METHLEITLKEIKHLLNHPDFQLSSSLENHRTALRNQVQRLNKLLATLEKTLSSLQGEGKMSEKECFEGFDKTRYEDETRERWGQTPRLTESQQKWSSYTEDQKEEIKAEGGEIAERLVTGNPDVSADDPDVQAAVGEYYEYLNKYFYSCDVGFLRGLVDMWVQDPRFAVNYERIRKG